MLLVPLNDLLKGIKRNSTKPLDWGQSAEDACNAIKQQLISLTHFTYPVPHVLTVLSTDALAEAVSAALQQEVDSELCPITFFSKRLEPAQQLHSAFDRELLVMHEAVYHFCHFLESWEFHVLTNHKPLMRAMVQSGDNLTPHVCQQLAFISEFTTNIRHIWGEEKPAADTLFHGNTLS